jgi:hypothetical protein
MPTSFSILELAANAGVSRSTLYNEIRAGRLVVRKIGRRTIVSAADAAAWFDSLAKGTSPGVLGRGVA